MTRFDYIGGFETDFIWYIVLIILIIGIYLLCWYVKTLPQRNYLIMEINRSLDLGEQKYWKDQLLKVNMTVIPFFGSFIYKAIRKLGIK